MDIFLRVFPYDKRIMLNALYDTLEILGLEVETANSERGEITAVSTEKPFHRISITCVSRGEGHTLVRLQPDLADDRAKALACVLLDEIGATVKSSLGLKEDRPMEDHHNRRRKK